MSKHTEAEFQKQPVVQFACQGMVHVHWFRLAPHHLRAQLLKALVVLRGNHPQVGILSLFRIQSLTKDEQGVVALGKRMSQIGTLSCSAVAIVHFSVAELYHQVVFIQDVQSHQFCSHSSPCH